MELGYTNQELEVNSIIKISFKRGWRTCRVQGDKKPSAILGGESIMQILYKADEVDDDLGVTQFAVDHHAYYVIYNCSPHLLIPSPIKNVWILCDLDGYDSSANGGFSIESLFYVDHPKSKKIFPLLFRGGHTAIVHTIAKNEGLTNFVPKLQDNIWTVKNENDVIRNRRKSIIVPFPTDVEEVVFTIRDPFDRWISTANIFTNTLWHCLNPWKMFACSITDKEDMWRMAAWLPQFLATSPSSFDPHFIPQHFVYKIFTKMVGENVKVSFVNSSDLTNYWNKVLGEPFYYSHKHRDVLIYNKEDIPQDVKEYLLNVTLKKDIEFVESMKHLSYNPI